MTKHRFTETEYKEIIKLREKGYTEHEAIQIYKQCRKDKNKSKCYYEITKC